MKKINCAIDLLKKLNEETRKQYVLSLNSSGYWELHVFHAVDMAWYREDLVVARSLDSAIVMLRQFVEPVPTKEEALKYVEKIASLHGGSYVENLRRYIENSKVK